MQQQLNCEEELDRMEYISHWVPLRTVAAGCSKKKPFVKLRKFKEESFGRKHEIILNHLHIQRFYLVAFALSRHLELELSDHYYIREGLIFGVYHLSSGEPRPATGISMTKEVELETSESYYEIIEKYFHSFCQVVQNLGFNPAGEYEGFIEGINRVFDKKANHIEPLQFIEAFEKWPLAEHYVFRVKLGNSMLLPTILADPELLADYRAYIRSEKLFIVSIMENSGQLNQLLAGLEESTRHIFGKLEKQGRIAEMTVNYTKTKAKPKQKETKELKIVTYFRVILSPSRSQVTINEKEIEENFVQKGSKPLTKIEIKPQNGMISPVSGNVISVTSSWEIDPDRKMFTLKIECFNNRKLEEIYFDEVLSFWNLIQGNPEFQELIGVDKYSLSLNENKMMEVAFANLIPGCMLSAAIKQIDKVVALTVSMDEIVQICERKGMQNEDPMNYQIEPFMVEQTKQKFKRALSQINKNSKELFR